MSIKLSDFTAKEIAIACKGMLLRIRGEEAYRYDNESFTISGLYEENAKAIYCIKGAPWYLSVIKSRELENSGHGSFNERDYQACLDLCIKKYCLNRFRINRLDLND